MASIVEKIQDTLQSALNLNATSSTPSTGKKALLLGAGFVTKPTVELPAKSGTEVTVACRTLASAQKLSSGIPNTKAISLDVSDDAALDAEMEK
ncbi:saccharopine dehydrogenase (NADP+, L-glutamate-forming), partial [Elasticomyces elasticus]